MRVVLDTNVLVSAALNPFRDIPIVTPANFVRDLVR